MADNPDTSTENANIYCLFFDDNDKYEFVKIYKYNADNFTENTREISKN